MKILRSLSVIIFFLSMAGIAPAQEGTGPGKCPPYDEPGRTFDASPIVDAIDTNGDDRMSREEWSAAGAPEPSWNMFTGKEKVKAQGYITREDFIKETPPNGIDTDCNGLITIDEFLATKKWKMGPPPGGAAQKRPTISAGERALAMLEVQNIFSKHAYYHQVGKHCDEIEDIWVAEDGPNAETAKWTLSGRTLYKGIAKIKYEYCTKHMNDQKKTLEELSKKISSIRNIPENIGAGSEYVMHTQETPVIEVAGDGKTAKGIWYSIGLAVRGSVDESGNTSVGTGWMWEKYGVDFIKENGEWKIWHLINLMDQGPAESQGQDAHAHAPGGPPPGGPPPGGPPPGGPGAPPDGQGDDDEQVTGHFSWSPTAVPRIDPPFPEPYYTFSETFSY